VKAQIFTLGAEQNTESHDPKSLEVAHPSIDDELTGVPDTAGLDSPKVKVKSSRKHLPEFRTPDILPSQLSRETLPATPHASKRPPEENATRPDSISERPAKRVRPWLRARHTLDPTQFQAVKHSPKPGDTTSPLFFSSHSSKHRPAILQEYTSPRLAARMLNKARDESGAITTLKLARGSMSSISSSPRAGTPSNMASFDRRSNIQSPDVKGKSPGMQLLGAVGVAELLEQDERPTFIIDVANPLNFTPGGPLIIIFANASLRGYDSILEMVTGKEVFDNPGIVHDFPEFKSWALSFVKNSESMDVCLPSFSYGGLTWTCSTLRKRLRLFSCSGNSIASGGGSSISNGANPSAASPIMIDRNRGPNILATGRSPLIQLSEPADYFGDVIKEEESIPRLTSDEPVSSPMSTDDRSPPKQAMIAAQNPGLTREMLNTRYPDNSSFDWTRLPLSAALPKHIQFARSIDWASTALGPIENWSFDLRAMCNLIMGSPHPAAMYWGPEYIAIYNEAYIMLAGKKHPQLMGQSYKVAWAEIWDEIEDVFLNARLSGQSTMKDDDCLFIKRNEYYEESYFSWSIIPLIGEDGSVVGLYNPAFDKTRRKIAERRMLTLREIGDKTAVAREVKGFWNQVIKGLEYNGKKACLTTDSSPCDYSRLI
jgi:PAS domain-containing protein